MSRTIVVGIVLLCFGVSAIAGDGGPTDPAKRLSLAQKLTNVGRYDEAIAICREPAVDALGIGTRQCLISALTKGGRDAEAETEFQKMFDNYASDKNLADAIVAVADTQFKQKRMVKAKALYMLARQKGAGGDAGARALAGLAKISIGEGDKIAAQDYVAGLMKDYSGRDVVADSVRSIAGEYTRRGMKSAAIATLENAATSLHGTPRLKVLSVMACASIEEQDGKVEAMIKTMKDEAKASPDSSLLLMPLGSTYLDQKKAAEARALFKWIRDEGGAGDTTNPKFTRLHIYCDLCDILVAIGEGTGDIVKQANALCAKYPDRTELPDAMLRIGVACYERGKAKNDATATKQAKEMFAAITSRYGVFPQGVTAGLLGARLDIANLVVAGKVDEAEAALTKLKTDYAGNRALQPAIDDVATKYYERGLEIVDSSPNSAKDCFQKAIAILEATGSAERTQAAQASAYYIAGLSYDRLGKLEKAAKRFEAAYATNPKHKYADYCLYARGLCYERLLAAQAVPEVSTKPLIKSAYKQLTEAYPQSQYSQHAAEWLQTHGR